jgi:NFU1 iron-sulfur cluster scaffold homolog, mitochondrial
MFIQTEDTPNPLSMKFIADRAVLGLDANGRPAIGMDFPNAETAKASPLAMTLFDIDGVSGVFLGPDFVTVTKAEGAQWAHVKPSILGAIADFLTAGIPVIDKTAVAPARKPATSVDDYEGDDREIVEQIIDLIDTRVRPAVAADGGDIAFQHWEPRTGVVFVSLHGSCSGCPSSTMTLKAGIENMLKHYLPEIAKVEAVA